MSCAVRRHATTAAARRRPASRNAPRNAEWKICGMSIPLGRDGPGLRVRKGRASVCTENPPEFRRFAAVGAPTTWANRAYDSAQFACNIVYNSDARYFILFVAARMCITACQKPDSSQGEFHVRHSRSKLAALADRRNRRRCRDRRAISGRVHGAGSRRPLRATSPSRPEDHLHRRAQVHVIRARPRRSTPSATNG